MKSGSLKLLETSGPVQACMGIAFIIQIHDGLNIGVLYSLILFTVLCLVVFIFFLLSDATRRPPTATHYRLKLTIVEAITQKKVVYDKG